MKMLCLIVVGIVLIALIVHRKKDSGYHSLDED